MSIKVYLAGPYRARTILKDCADELDRIGYTVVCRWLDGDHEGAPDAAADAPVEDRQRWAREDLQDVDACGVLVAFTADAVGKAGASGGRHIETGYALARNKTVVLVGEPENVFHWLPQVNRVPDWHAAVVLLARLLVNHEHGQPRAVES
jgi:nucleoside 2-deoxyribosyltransferase